MPEEPIKQETPKKESKQKIEILSRKEEVTEINKGGKLRRTNVLKLSIMHYGKKDDFVIKKLAYGEIADFTSKFINVQLVGEISKTNIDLKNIRMQTLLMCLHEAPFPIDLDYVQWELDGPLGNVLYKECETYNKLSDTQKKK